MVNNISKDIRYIGVDDLDIDLFESQYIVPEGMSYNSWVILDEKVAIMDTADKRKDTKSCQRTQRPHTRLSRMPTYGTRPLGTRWQNNDAIPYSHTCVHGTNS